MLVVTLPFFSSSFPHGTQKWRNEATLTEIIESDKRSMTIVMVELTVMMC